MEWNQAGRAAAQRGTKARRRPKTGLRAVEALESRQLLATIAVTTTADGDSRDTVLTFREALLVANGTLAVSSLSAQEQTLVSGSVNSGTGNTPDSIIFTIPGGGIATLAVPVPLPEATDPVLIDATTQPGSTGNTATDGTNAAIRVTLPAGLVLNGGSTLRGLSMPLGGLFLSGGNNRVEGNFIGVLPDGATAPGLNQGAASQTGIIVSSSGNTIGGSVIAARNLISGNNVSGILVQGGAAGTVIQGNLVGTNALGAAALPNGAGIKVTSATSTLIGGTASASSGNVISGNATFGVQLAPQVSGDSITGTVIQGNRIGTNAAGTAALGNGIGVTLTATNTTIGGLASGARNVISGNPGGGLGIVNATGTIVQGNYIGTNAVGTAAVGNGQAGLAVQGGSGTSIGGNVTGAGNLISGNNGHGIFVANPGAGSEIKGNYIGVAADAFTVLRNFGSGVRVAGANGLIIGGPSLDALNVISYNGDGGVMIESGTGVQVRSNSIYGNLGQGIDLGADGPTANDSGDADTGPNNLLNFPTLLNVSGNDNGTTTTIQGTYNGPANTLILIQFFSSPYMDPTARGEGQVFLGESSLTTDASGNVNFISTVPTGTALGQPVTAVAIDPSGNTSEFSQGLPRTTATTTDLAVSITSSTDTPTAGQNVTYTVSVTNNGTNPATNVSLVSGLGSGSVLDSVTVSKGGFSTATGAVEVSFGTLAVGETATATVVTRTIAAGNTFLSGLTYSAETETNGANNGTVKVIGVNAGPNVGVTAQAPASAQTDQDVTFVYTVTNAGPGAASGVTFTSNVPAGATFVSVTTDTGTASQTGGVATANLGTLAVNQTAIVQLVLRRAAAGALTSSAFVSLNEVDSNPQNNAAQATTNITAPALPVDVATGVTATPNPAFVGQPITFTVYVANIGGAAASPLLAAQLGAGLVIREARSTQGTVAVNGSTVNVDLGPMAAGGQAVLVVVATPTLAGSTGLTATVTTTGDGTPANDVASVPVEVAASVNNTIVRDLRPLLISGRLRGYTLFFSNPIDSVTATADGATRIVSPGRDGQLGTADDVDMPIRRAGYDIATQSLTLMVRNDLPLGRFVAIQAKGTGPNAIMAQDGLPIDGDGDGLPGGDLIVTTARGRNLTYTDSDGDRVNIRLRGSTGTMDMIRGPLGNARALLIYNGNRRRTSLVGSVTRRSASDGVARLPIVIGLDTVQNRLRNNEFQIGSSPS